MITDAFSAPLKKFTRNPVLIIASVVYAAIWTFYAIDPVWRPQWWLDNYLVFALVAVLVATYRKYQLSDVSYILIAVFMSLHAIGAHSGYSSVELGFWMSRTFGFERPNVYDRLVHFLFGLLLAYPLHELLRRYSQFKRVWLYVLPADFILSYSALYELIEAMVAWTLPPEEYDPFVGLQGDIYDGYRDMLCALSGAVICVIVIALIAKRRMRVS